MNHWKSLQKDVSHWPMTLGAEDNQDMADQSAMDAFLHGVLDTESAYSAMDKKPSNSG